MVLAAAGYWYFELRPAQQSTGALSASGTIEASQVQISPELSGKIMEVMVSEGDRVQAGQELVRLDQTLLLAQLEQARAAQAQSQANYELVAAGTPAEQRQAAIAAAELELTSARQALQTLYDTADLARAQAEQAVAAADKARDQAQDRLDSLLGEADPEDIERAESQVTIAADNLKKAKEDYDKGLKYLDKNVARAINQIKVSDAKTAYDVAVTRLNNLLGHANQIEVTLAESNVKLAEAALSEAKRELEKVKDGPDPDALALAQARLASAESRLASAKAGPSVEQLSLAQTQVDNAQRAVETLEIQLKKMVLLAPTDGVVLSSSAEPGEFSTPGATLLVLGRDDDKTITVYIPEDRFGLLSIGQPAVVSVDSFPGARFDAKVVNIADQAEFTPRNVQTVEGRKNTVFAIKLKVDDPQDKLKSGMPADVTFE
ncbi:MAG: HlyD family secretion protein [Chloroflexi bacterium]|nr:HlyD family secretion protein [Chloroflexota bacterium]